MKEKFYENYLTTYFGKYHDDTDKEFRIYSTYYKKNYLKYLPQKKNARILDLGCGPGHFLYFLEDYGYRNYLGVDFCEENVKFCKERNFNVISSDIFRFLQENQKCFDVIVMNDVIEHFKKEEIIDLFRLINKNLNKEGAIFIKVVNSANPILANSSRYLDFTHEIGFTEESLFQVLKIGNFKDVKIYPQDIYIFYSNPLNYVAKFASFALNKCFKLIFLIYGRESTKIFTKDLIAIGRK